MTDPIDALFAPATLPRAFARYRAIAHRLPALSAPARPAPKAPERIRDLRGVFDRVDGFILDAFGVLNRGTQAVPGAAQRLRDMQAAGKRVVLLTNGALLTRPQVIAKFAAWDMHFAPDQIISSRDLALSALERIDGPIAAIAPPDADLSDMPRSVRALTPDLLTEARAFVFLDAIGYTRDQHQAVVTALVRNPRPVICANPDIVAPRDTGFSWEPGHFCHALPVTVPVQFLGKPFAPAFAGALARIGLPAARVAMVGDTLHTDVLGGAANGCQTVMITDHGFLAGYDPAPFMAASGLTPDFIAPSP